jgi:hypothetical protein
MQRLWRHKCSTSTYSQTYGDHDDPGISDPAEIAKVDDFGLNPETPQHDGVQWWYDLNPTQPFGRPRVRERGGGGEGGAEGGGEEARGLLLCVLLIPWGPLYIVGRGSTNPSTKAP